METEKFSVDILSEDPINPKQSLSSDIDREGLAYLKTNPDKYFRKVFEQQGKLMVNIYTSDKATTEGCVSCHTSIKNKQYEIGDILGMRKFSLVYSEDVAMGKTELSADLEKFIHDKNLFVSTLMALQSGGVISLEQEGTRIKPVKPVEDPEFQKQLKLVQTQFEGFINLTDVLVDLEVSSVQFRRLYQEILEFPDRLTEESNALTNIFVKVADRNQQYIKAVVIASAVLTLFLLFSLYLYLSRSVLSPVITVSNTLSYLAKGNLEQTLITCQSKDEIGDLSISSNQLISQLKTFIESTANTLAGKSQNENDDSELSGEFYSALKEIREQVEARKKAQKELENAHEQLEMKVEKRTAELHPPEEVSG